MSSSSEIAFNTSSSTNDLIRPEIEERFCQNCGEREVEDDFQLLLCHRCRTELANRPIPLWIKGTTLVILVLLIYSLSQFPSSLSAGIHYKRGQQAYTNHKNWTAVHEFEQAADRFPDSTKILARLFLAYYHSGQIDKANQLFGEIGGKTAEDENMANLINNVVSEMDRRYYSDEELEGIYTESDIELRIARLKEYIIKHPESVSAQYFLADSLYDAKKFNEVESIVMKLQKTETDFDNATLLLAAAYRETKQYDKATHEVQSVLSRNSESDGAYFALSRIELKQHMDKQGLIDAQKAYDLNPDNGANIANLALANYYNQKMDERDRLVNLLHNREDYGQKQLDQLNSIFSQQTAWRD